MEYKGNIDESIETYNQTYLAFTNYTKQKNLDLLVKRAGGKEKELKFIIPNLPEYFENYYDSFVVGGSVYTAIQSNKAFINDKSIELISLYKIIKSNVKSHINFFQKNSKRVARFFQHKSIKYAAA